ncbi:MAG: hypothetical protein Q9186_002575 [Xanthomendoza sp. 1 TL-2023]
MSGIEVAGLALAVFPILINGLNHVVDGIETAKRWKRYRVKLKDYADELETASVYFFDTLDELLGDIVTSDGELALLLDNPGGMAWKQIKYEERLRKRLDRSHSSYLKTVSKLAKALQAMCDRLGVDSAGTVKWDDFSTLEREMKRLKLTFSKNIYKELLEDIRQANRDLREFTHQNIALEPVKQKRQARRPIADLRLIRKHAASLYQVLMTDQTWKCTCQMHHMASLRLEARPRMLEEKTNPAQRHPFRILLSVAKEASNTASAMQWQYIDIFPTGENQASPKGSHFHHNPHRLESARGVRFALEPHLYLASLSDGGSSAETTDVEMTHIESFCSALCTSHTDQLQREIGLLIDKANDEQQHRVYRADTAKALQTSSRSLENLLSSQRQTDDESLSRKDRLQIAVILASSVLQLDGTSWLKSGWSSNDIFFHSKNGQVSKSYPYLSWQPCCSTKISRSFDPPCISNYMIRSDILLALGLTLVELCFGRTLADMRKPADVDVTETTTRLKTATRVHDRVYDEMGIPYGDVVRRCLFQLFDVRELSLDIEEVQQKVFDDVVTPLVDDLNNFNGELRIR